MVVLHVIILSLSLFVESVHNEQKRLLDQKVGAPTTHSPRFD